MEKDGGIYLERHRKTLKKTALKIFAKELGFQDLTEKFPVIKWTETKTTPSAFYLYLLCYFANRKTLLFCEEMLSHWLSPGDELKILSSKNLNFKLPNWKRDLFFAEFLVHVPDEKCLERIKRQLPIITDEMKLGTVSYGHAKHILEMKRLSLAGKTSFIYDTLVRLIKRYPKFFGHDVFREIQHLLVHSREEFRNIRPARHLCRLVSCHYLFQKALESDIKSFPFRRHLYLKFIKTHLHYPFGLKKVLGLVISLNSLRDYECLDFRHVFDAIERVIPNVSAHKESFYSHHNEENNILKLYIEIEKSKDVDFTLEDIKKLKKELPNELKNSIEYLSPSLFLPRNEEELIRNIIQLAQELKRTRDLPQVMISFQEQRNENIRFNVVLLRILSKPMPSLQELSRTLLPQVHFIPERVAGVGFLRKKYVKEANVFSLEVESKLFLRKNHSVDLIKARTFVVKALEKMIGSFRDFNGSFLLKQNQELETIKKLLGARAKQNEFLLENLFYSLNPPFMQVKIPSHIGKEFAELFFQTVEKDFSIDEECRLEIKQTSEFTAAILTITLSELKEEFLAALKKENFEKKVIRGVVEVNRLYYICFLFLSPHPEEASHFIQTFQEKAQGCRERKENLQILHLHQPRAAQSLDPRLGADRTSGIVIKMLYEGLFRQTDSGEIENAIAKEVHLSQDGLKYTFKLRPSFWSNGSPLTAYDFEYAWKKVLEPDFRFPYSFLFFSIKNAEAAKKGEKSLSQVGVRAADEETLVVDLEYKAPYFLGLTTTWVFSPLCREIDQKHPGWAYHSGESYVCNGPFKLDVWKRNDDIQVIKNPRYWDAGSVKLDQIRISIIEDENLAVNKFFRNELDWIGDPISKLPSVHIPKLSQKGMLNSAENQYGLFWTQLNTQSLPFKNAKIRKAFSLAINREHLIQKVLYSDDIPASGFTFKPDPFGAHPYKNGDMKKAMTLFREGLSELNLRKEDFPQIVFSHSEIEEHVAITREIGRQWSECFEIHIHYEKQLWNAYFESLCSGKLMAGCLVWYPRFEDPIYYYNLFIFREYSLHVTNWKNPFYNDLVEKAKRMPDLKKKMHLLDQAEQILAEELPVIPLLYQKFRYIKNPKLKDCILSNVNQIDFRKAYLETQTRANK